LLHCSNAALLQPRGLRFGGNVSSLRNYSPDAAKGELGMAMIPRERCSYSAIVDRPPLMLPHGARIAVWTVVNL